MKKTKKLIGPLLLLSLCAFIYSMQSPLIPHQQERTQQKQEDLNHALLQAVQKGDINAIALALRNGADIDARYINQTTPLIIVANKIPWLPNAYEVINFLLNNGADVDDKNNQGITALMIASQYDPTIYKNDAIVKLLLQKGADISIKDRTGNQAFHWAHPKIKDLLEVQIFEAPKSTPYELGKQVVAAAASGDFQTIARLIKQSASLNTQDINGKTAAMWAAQNNHAKALGVLGLRGANLNLKDNQGKTVIDYARGNKQAWAMLLQLEQRGIKLPQSVSQIEKEMKALEQEFEPEQEEEVEVIWH